MFFASPSSRVPRNHIFTRGISGHGDNGTRSIRVWSTACSTARTYPSPCAGRRLPRARVDLRFGVIFDPRTSAAAQRSGHAKAANREFLKIHDKGTAAEWQKEAGRVTFDDSSRSQLTRAYRHGKFDVIFCASIDHFAHSARSDSRA